MILTSDYRVVTAGELIDYRYKNKRDPKDKSFLEIGHGETPDSIQLWIWLDGKLQVSPLYHAEIWEMGHSFPEIQSHQSLWGDEVEVWKCYRGRFEVEAGELSVVIPASGAHRKVPSVIMKELERKFDYKRIHVF